MHILDSLNRGGAEMLALDVCRNASVNKLDLTFVATGGGDLEEDFRHSGVNFIRLKRRLSVDLSLAAKLREIIRERGIQIVHCHQAVEALHAYLATLGTKVKRVLSFHLCTADTKNRLALNFLAPRMDANVAVSHDLLNCLGSEAGFETSEKFHVIYNGVDMTRLKPRGSSLRAELGLTESGLLLGMIGNFYPDARKDQMTSCRALPQLFACVPDAHFAFVGGHSQTAPQAFDECVNFCRQQNIAGRVHFLGKRVDIPDVLRSLDIYVHSAVNESLGIAVIEAMLVGLPTIVSDIGALLEVTRNGDCAAVFRHGDAEDLARRLLELMSDPQRRARLGAQAREWAVQQFSIETHIANLLKLYEALVSTK